MAEIPYISDQLKTEASRSLLPCSIMSICWIFNHFYLQFFRFFRCRSRPLKLPFIMKKAKFVQRARILPSNRGENPPDFSGIPDFLEGTGVRGALPGISVTKCLSCS